MGTRQGCNKQSDHLAQASSVEKITFTSVDWLAIVAVLPWSSLSFKLEVNFTELRKPVVTVGTSFDSIGIVVDSHKLQLSFGKRIEGSWR